MLVTPPQLPVKVRKEADWTLRIKTDSCHAIRVRCVGRIPVVSAKVEIRMAGGIDVKPMMLMRVEWDGAYTLKFPQTLEFCGYGNDFGEIADLVEAALYCAHKELGEVADFSVVRGKFWGF